MAGDDRKNLPGAAAHSFSWVWTKGAEASRINAFNASGKPMTCCADLLRRNAMKAKAQRRRKRLGFSLDAGHPAEAGG